ncbi:MAG: PAS domain S-box protein [Magnetococcales bacterium]|nr:PAS domain S-box protein [Magnetococcales bacterium]
MVAFGLLSVIFLLSLHWMHVEQEENQSTVFEQQVLATIQLLIQENYQVLEGQLALLALDRILSDLFQKGDQDGLQRATSPLLTRLQATQGVATLSFYTREGSLFLRLHQPDPHEKESRSPTVLRARKTGQTVHGLELNQMDTLVIRVVEPWVVDGHLVGYLEIGKELAKVLEAVNATLHTDIYLFIDKNYLSKDPWRAWMATQGRGDDWDRFADFVSAEGFKHNFPPMLDTLVHEDHVGVGTFLLDRPDSDNDLHFHYFIRPVLDVENRRVAKMIALFKDSPMEHLLNEHKTQVIAGISISALLLVLVFGRLIGRIGARFQKATAELRLSEERNRAILDTALDAIISIDANGTILEFNKAAERIFKFGREDIVGKKIGDTLIPPELQEGHKQGMARYLTTGERRVVDKHVEMEALDCDARRMPIEIAITAIHDRESTFFTAFLRDISERKETLASLHAAITEAQSNNLSLRQEVVGHQRTMARLQASEERFRSVTHSIRDAIIAADQEQTIVFWNRGAEVLFGYDAREAVGKKVTILIPERFTSVHLQGYQRFLENGTGPLIGQSTELSGLRKDGSEFPLEMSLNSWSQADGSRFFSAIIRDISDRKRDEDALLNAKERAEEANKAKGLFLANISHEIRTPMNTIIGMGYLLQQTSLKPGQRGQLGKIQHAAEALLAMINDILDFSKIDSGRMELELIPFVLVTVLEKVKDQIVLRAAEKGLKIVLSVPKDLPRSLLGDPLRLEQILINLGTNAVKFTAAGEIVFRILPRDRTGDAITLAFSVQDTGIGMTEAQIAKLFQPFVQADSTTTRNYGGTGLGLAICKNLVELMGGTIQVKSAPGSGSEFAFTLPFALTHPAFSPANETIQAQKHKREPTMAQRVEPVMDVSGTMTRKARILVVEDHDTNWEVAHGILTQGGLLSERAVNGLQAIKRLEAERDHFDVVLMDLQMPVMDGYDATCRLRDLYTQQQLPIIAMTANALHSEKEKCLSMGMNDYITKPINVKELFRVLEHYVPSGMVPPIKVAAPVLPNAGMEELLASIGIDRREALDRLGGDEELFRRLLIKFAKTHVGDDQRLLTLFAARDWQGLKAMLHGLKGIAGNISAQKLCELAARAEKMADCQDVPGCQVVLDAFCNDFVALIAVLQTFDTPMVTVGNAMVGAEDAEWPTSRLQRLRQLLEDGDLEARHVFQVLRPELAFLAQPHALERMQHCLEQLDFDTGVRIVAEWLEAGER